MGSSKGQYLQRLVDHRDYLAERAADTNINPAALGHVKAELAALDWALPILGDLVAREAAEARNVHRQRAEAEWRNLAGKLARKLVVGGHGEEVEALLAEASEVVQNEVRRRLAPKPYGALVPPADDSRPADSPLWYHAGAEQ